MDVKTKMDVKIKTEPLYLLDTYQSHAQATVFKIDSDEQGNFLLLDQTIFYPQGGGQPYDTGRILCQGQELAITAVKKDTDGQIRHYFEELPSLDLMGKSVELEINSARRLENAKLHSAGHLLALIVEKLFPGIKATKGHHYPGEAYVEFNRIIDDTDQTLCKTIEAQFDKLIGQELSVFFKMVEPDEFKAIFGYQTRDEGLRIVTFEGFPPVPCGGTHISNLRELGKVIVPKIKTKKGMMKISYFV